MKKRKAKGEAINPRIQPGDKVKVFPQQSYMIRLEFSPSAFVTFASNIGFHYCCRKQMRLSAAVAYFRQNDCILRQRNWVGAPRKGRAVKKDKVTYGVHKDARAFPTFRVKLIAKRDAGVKTVYDLSVPNPEDKDYNSFTAAGLCVHNCSTSSSTSTMSNLLKEEGKYKKKGDPTHKKKGPFKFSHTQLEKDGVIMTSEVPEERRGNIFFSFSSASPGIFDVVVMYKNRVINEIKLQLDELLERQHNNHIEMETDFLKLNVNLLIYLLNKTFIS